MHQYGSRQNRLRKKLKLGKGEAFLVSNIKNINYLTGFSGSAASFIVAANQELLVSDSRYETQLSEECPDLECVIRDANSSALDTLTRVIASAKFSVIKFESESLTKSLFDQLESKLDGVELVSTAMIVEELRCIKDKSEIDAIRHSIRINQKAFAVIRSQLTADQTERQIAHKLEHQMRQFGAEGCAFDTIVSVGARSALPHAHPSEHRVEEHPILLIDWGTQVNRYASDLTRVLVTAGIPPKLRKIYDIVLAAQLAAIRLIRPGIAFKQVDAAARQVIEASGFGKYFGHGLGHGFGLDIHESPFLSPIHAGNLESGMVVTIEPGIYIPDWGGVRIEDDILVTQNGHEVLSDLPKELDQCVVELN